MNKPFLEKRERESYLASMNASDPGSIADFTFQSIVLAGGAGAFLLLALWCIYKGLNK